MTSRCEEFNNDDFSREKAVKNVENLAFLPGVLGEGAFGTVRLAKRKIGPSNDSSGLKSWSCNRIDRSKNNIFMHFLTYFSIKENEKVEDAIDLVAVKIFSKSSLKRKRKFHKDNKTKRIEIKTAFQQVEREIALMKKLSHPNLVQLYEVIDLPDTDILCMVLEFCPLGEILSYQAHYGKFKRSKNLEHHELKGLFDGHFDEEHAALYFVDILHGLAYLHQHNIVHRDLRPENILLSQRGIAKVGDFGVSMISSSSSVSSSSSSKREIELDNFSEAYDMKAMAGSGLLFKTEGTW